MILTYKIRHNTDFSTELKQAFRIAEFAVRNPKCRTSKDVKEFGLKSAISNQILKKYGNQKTLKQVHNVNLVVPNQAINVDKDNRTIRVVPLKLVLNYQFPDFQKVNQIELDKEFAYISCTIAEQPYLNNSLGLTGILLDTLQLQPTRIPGRLRNLANPHCTSTGNTLRSENNFKEKVSSGSW